MCSLKDCECANDLRSLARDIATLLLASEAPCVLAEWHPIYIILGDHPCIDGTLQADLSFTKLFSHEQSWQA